MANERRLDGFVSKVVTDPAKPADTVLLTGFLGPSSEDGHTRIYQDATLESYVDVPNDAILHTESLSKDHSPLGGSYIWLKKDAEVLHGKVGTDRKKAKFLEGPIQAFGQAAGLGAVAPAAGPATFPVIACPPLTVLPGCGGTKAPVCESLTIPVCGPSVAAPCPSQMPSSCPTRCPGGPTQAHTACPTPCPGCPTQFHTACPTPCPVCPTEMVTPCPGCPTQHPAPCPSVAPSPCPTVPHSACPVCPTVHPATCPTVHPATCPTVHAPCPSVNPHLCGPTQILIECPASPVPHCPAGGAQPAAVSQVVHCIPSVQVICHQPSVIVACAPSVAHPCATQALACRPSVLVACPTLQLSCPSVLHPCISVQVHCPTLVCPVQSAVCPSVVCPSLACGPGGDPGF
jgi:hypothetical protein